MDFIEKAAKRQKLLSFKRSYPETINCWWSVSSGFVRVLKIWTYSVQHGNALYNAEYVIFEMTYADDLIPGSRLVFGPSVAGLLSEMNGTWAGVQKSNADELLSVLHQHSEGEIDLPPVVVNEIINSIRLSLKPL